MNRHLRALLTGLDRIAYPPECLLCAGDFDRHDEFSLCEECRRELLHDPHLTCPRCGGTVGPHVDLDRGCNACRGESFPFESVRRLGPYEGKLRDAILRSKYLAGEILAETIGRLWARRDREILRGLALDVIVPIPLHWLRRIERGYNQSAALAVSVADELQSKSGVGWLRRIKPTPKQSTQSATARRENVRGAFRATRRCRVRNLRVLLVDDVLTTGATASEAARVLRSAGAAQVTVAVLARR